MNLLLHIVHSQAWVLSPMHFISTLLWEFDWIHWLQTLGSGSSSVLPSGPVWDLWFAPSALSLFFIGFLMPWMWTEASSYGSLASQHGWSKVNFFLWRRWLSILPRWPVGVITSSPWWLIWDVWIMGLKARKPALILSHCICSSQCPMDQSHFSWNTHVISSLTDIVGLPQQWLWGFWGALASIAGKIYLTGWISS